MSSAREVYFEDTYRGVVVIDNARRVRGKVTGFYKSMLDGLFKLGCYAREGSKYQRPVSLMFSFAMTDESLDYPISKVMTKVWNAFSKSRLPRFDKNGERLKHGRQVDNTFKPEYLWCRETKYLDNQSPEFHESLTSAEQECYRFADLDGCPIPYQHYHVLIVLDDKKGCWQSIKVVLDGLVASGVVRAGFHFSQNNVTKQKTLNLKDDKEFEEFIYRGAYICKVDTKQVTEQRFWGRSSCRAGTSKPNRRKSK